jgi:hypothetical protein
MPAYHDNEWGDYKASVRRTGIRKLIHWYPYFNVSRIGLILKVTQKINSRYFSYEWLLLRWDGKQQHHVRQGGDKDCITSPEQPIIGKIELPRLVIPGQHILKLAMSSKQRDATFDQQVMANFNILERDSLIIKLIFAILAIIASALIGIFIRLL